MLGCNTLRVKIWEYKGPGLWKLVTTYLFHGATREEAKVNEANQRRRDSFYYAVVTKGSYQGARLKYNAAWLC